jgi:hypothetical protein
VLRGQKMAATTVLVSYTTRIIGADAFALAISPFRAGWLAGPPGCGRARTTVRNQSKAMASSLFEAKMPARKASLIGETTSWIRRRMASMRSVVAIFYAGGKANGPTLLWVISRRSRRAL